MDASAREFVSHILDREHDLTWTAVRPGGYPQAAMVVVADCEDWNPAKGLSMGGTAGIRTDPEQARQKGCGYPGRVTV